MGVVAATISVDPVATTAVASAADDPADLLSQDETRNEADVSRGNDRDEPKETDPATAEAQAAEAAWLASVEARHEALSSTAVAIEATDVAITARLAEEKAAQERAEAALMRGGTPAQNKELGRKLASELYGWGGDQFACFDNIIVHESRWITTADNPTSSAYGIPQALPGKKMASEGADWETNPATQIRWGLKYIKDRYGTPCQALSFRQGAGWY